MSIAGMTEYGVTTRPMRPCVPDAAGEEIAVDPGAPLEPAAALAGAVAHDLGNMLTVVLGNAELLVEGLADRPALMDLAALILGAAQRGTELTSRLDRFARPVRAGDRPTDTNQLLAEFGRRVAYSIPPEIRFEMVVPAALHRVDLPGPALVSVLDELVANALAALDGQGTLRIAARNETAGSGEPRLVIAVEDDAAGMDPETLRRARAVRFTAGVAGHRTAIGLALALRVVQTGKGRLLVVSFPRQGTRVTIDLPAMT